MKFKSINVLLIEDNPRDVRLILEMNKELGLDKFEIAHSGNLAQGIEQFSQVDFNLILLDLRLPDSNGFDTFKKMLEKAQNVPIIILTGTDDLELAIEAVKIGAEDYLVKGQVDSILLKRSINYAIERYDIKKKLKLSEAKYRNLVNNITDAIIETNLDGTLTYVSPQIFDITGYTAEESTGVDGFQFIRPDDITTVKKGFEEAELTGNIVSMEFRIKHKDGHYIFCMVRGCIVNVDGIPKMIATMSDITKRKKAEEKTKYQAMLVDNVSDAIISTDLDFNIVTWNKAAERTYGWNAEEIIGKNVMDTITVKYPYDNQDDILKQLFEEGYWRGEVTQLRKDGIWLNLLTALSLIKDGEGKPIGTVAINHDITERKKSEKNLKESEKKFHEAYNKANFYKDLFTHDMNNILQNLLSAADLCLENLRTSNNRELSNEIIKHSKSQIERGARLILNVQQLSQLEEIKMQKFSIEVQNTLKKSIEHLKNSFLTREINVDLDIFDEKIKIRANELIEDAFENILNNAVRHNENKVVEISIKITSEIVDGKEYLKFEFLDNGVGIPDEWKNVIFLGYNEANALCRIGLGLSLVKTIIESYEGRIWVEDRVKGDYSRGSNVVLLIPEVI